jgi:hypothetical protein
MWQCGLVENEHSNAFQDRKTGLGCCLDVTINLQDIINMRLEYST